MIFLQMILLTIGIICLQKPRYSLGYFVVCRILIPENFRILNGVISLNTLNILFCVISILLYGFKHHIYIEKFSKKFIMGLLLYMAYSIVVLPLSDYGDLIGQYNNLVQFFITDILPALLMIIGINNECDLKCIIKSFLIATVITCTYGILTVVISYNPISVLFECNEMVTNSWKGASTSATFVSTNAFGYFLALTIPFVYYLEREEKEKKGKRYLQVLIVLLVINLLLCKKRSAIIAILAFCVFLFIHYISKKKIDKRVLKLSVLMVPLGIIMVVVLFNIPAFSKVANYLKATLFFWNDNVIANIAATGELGSTMELRIRQVMYPFIEIHNNIILGHGFGWAGWYLNKYKLHPMLFGFESIFASGICEFGIAAVFVYSALFKISYDYCKSYKPKKDVGNYALIFVLVYIIDTVATGFNYFFLFEIMVVLLGKVEKIHVRNVYITN